MNLQITKSFKDDTSPRPFLAGELVTVPSETGKQWIAEGRAIERDFPVRKPTRAKREKAVIG